MSNKSKINFLTVTSTGRQNMRTVVRIWTELDNLKPLKKTEIINV